MHDDNKVVFYGETGVGKSTLLHRLIKNEFLRTGCSTIGASFYIYNHETQINSVMKTVSMHMWDTAGQERFHSLTPMYMRGAKVVIFCFNNPDVKTIRKKIQYISNVDPKAKVFLVATKVELHEQKAIFEDVGLSLNERVYCTSSKTGEGIRELFDDIAHFVYTNLRDVQYDEKTLQGVTIDFRSETETPTSVGHSCKFW